MKLPRLFRWIAVLVLGFNLSRAALPEGVEEVVSGVYFHEGEWALGHSNNGWVEFEDFVLVIDANYPSGARLVLPKIKAMTDKPIKVVFDTHHHPDHAYGNRVWADAGALLVAQVGASETMKKAEPAGWNGRAAQRPGMRTTSLKFPQILFGEELLFEDAEATVELRWFGAGHTPGDGFAWLPEHKILFTGDSIVNGPFNYMGDAHIGAWIETLEKVKALGAEIVCPGHGAVGGAELIAGQQAYLIALRSAVQALRDSGATPTAAKAAVPGLMADLKANAEISNWVGQGMFPGQVERVWRELGGAAFPR